MRSEDSSSGRNKSSLGSGTHGAGATGCWAFPPWARFQPTVSLPRVSSADLRWARASSIRFFTPGPACWVLAIEGELYAGRHFTLVSS